MRIETTIVDGVTVLRPADGGEIDVALADEFLSAVLAAAGSATSVVLDCEPVTFFDSSGMGALLSIHRAIVEERKGRFALARPGRSVKEMFRMVGFDVVFVFHADLASAVAAVKG